MPQIYKIKIIPNAKKNEIIEKSDNYLKIKITAQPQKNKANQALIKFLTKEFNKSKNKISIIKGEKNREKTIEILD